MKALAIDLGGSHVTCAIVEDKGLIASQLIQINNNKSLRALLPVIAATLKDLMMQQDCEPKDLTGCAFGFCGLVNFDANQILSTNGKFIDAPELNLTTWSKEELGLPLALENDARLALLGEQYIGAARGYDDAVMITLGTGIGGAAMIKGKLLRGKHFQAGCLGGHFPISLNGRRCGCGNLGCVEAEASTWSLPEICRDWHEFNESSLSKESNINFERLAEGVKAGDPVCKEIFNHCLLVWATGAVALIHAYDPEVTIFGGAVMRSADLILPFIERHVHKHAWTPWGKVNVQAALLGEHAGLLGAVPLIQEKLNG